MEKLNFEQYRCECGKLLFKAFIIVSLVEVKCKRCGKITSFGEINVEKGSFSFLLSVDSEGTIRDMCKGAEMVLGYSRKNLVGTPIAKICPLIHDRLFSDKADKSSYKIPENNFLLHDGASIPTESYFIEPEPESGYHIFSKHRPIAT